MNTHLFPWDPEKNAYVMVEFAASNEIDWDANIKNIQVGDVVYIYAAYPIKQILLKTRVLDVLPPVNPKKISNIKLRFEKSFIGITDELSYENLKNYGLNQVEGQTYLDNKPALLSYIYNVEQKYSG